MHQWHLSNGHLNQRSDHKIIWTCFCCGCHSCLLHCSTFLPLLQAQEGKIPSCFIAGDDFFFSLCCLVLALEWPFGFLQTLSLLKVELTHFYKIASLMEGHKYKQVKNRLWFNTYRLEDTNNMNMSQVDCDLIIAKNIQAYSDAIDRKKHQDWISHKIYNIKYYNQPWKVPKFAQLFS